jgi:hypothetical protein
VPGGAGAVFVDEAQPRQTIELVVVGRPAPLLDRTIKLGLDLREEIFAFHGSVSRRRQSWHQ